MERPSQYVRVRQTDLGPLEGTPILGRARRDAINAAEQLLPAGGGRPDDEPAAAEPETLDGHKTWPPLPTSNVWMNSISRFWVTHSGTMSRCSAPTAGTLCWRSQETISRRRWRRIHSRRTTGRIRFDLRRCVARQVQSS